MVDFEDEHDKRRVMDMRPWHYEKQLVLLQEFEGEKNPKDIVLKWSPFLVQIYNLPLKSRTRETGKAIGASLGKVIDVDVADIEVQWGTCLRVQVAIEITRKLIRGRKITFEAGGARWVHFKYERLPNFCYRYGLLEHDLKDCLEGSGNDKAEERGDLQYGAWLRGEPKRMEGWEFGFAKKKEAGEMRNRAKTAVEGGRNEMVEVSDRVERDDHGLEAICLGEGTQVQQMEKAVGSEVTTEENHEKGKAENVGGSPKGVLANKGNEKWENAKGSGRNEASQQGMAGTHPDTIPKFEFSQAQVTLNHDCQVGLDLGLGESKEGLMAMSYEPNMGWLQIH